MGPPLRFFGHSRTANGRPYIQIPSANGGLRNSQLDLQAQIDNAAKT